MHELNFSQRTHSQTSEVEQYEHSIILIGNGSQYSNKLERTYKPEHLLLDTSLSSELCRLFH